MNKIAEKRRRLLDPCYSKVLNITNLQVSRMKLTMKLQLRALKKIAEEALQDANSVILLPDDVYESTLDTISNQFHKGFTGHYGTATENQLKAFFCDGIPKPIISVTTSVTTKEDSAEVDSNGFIISNVKSEPTASATTFDYNSSASCPVDDAELQNAIWQMCSGVINGNEAVPSEQENYNDFLMINADDERVLLDLN